MLQQKTQGEIRIDVDLKLSKEHKEPFAVIYASEINGEVQQAVSFLKSQSSIITASDARDRIVVLKPEDIFIIRIENSEAVIFCKQDQYRSKKRLYELKSQVGERFMQIAKSTLVNLEYIDSVEPSISGMMNLVMKNGCSEFISRKYLSEFKKYLGL